MARIVSRGKIRAYSIAEARNNLSVLVRQAESDSAIELTRHGKPVAVLVSKKAYDRLAQPQQSFFEALQQFRAEVDVKSLGISRKTFEGVRSRDPGRKTEL
jgi:prevent-host-death family protein